MQFCRPIQYDPPDTEETNAESIWQSNAEQKPKWKWQDSYDSTVLAAILAIDDPEWNDAPPESWSSNKKYPPRQSCATLLKIAADRELRHSVRRKAISWFGPYTRLELNDPFRPLRARDPFSNNPFGHLGGPDDEPTPRKTYVEEIKAMFELAETEWNLAEQAWQKEVREQERIEQEWERKKPLEPDDNPFSGGTPFGDDPFNSDPFSGPANHPFGPSVECLSERHKELAVAALKTTVGMICYSVEGSVHQSSTWGELPLPEGLAATRLRVIERIESLIDPPVESPFESPFDSSLDTFDMLALLQSPSLTRERLEEIVFDPDHDKEDVTSAFNYLTGSRSKYPPIVEHFQVEPRWYLKLIDLFEAIKPDEQWPPHVSLYADALISFLSSDSYKKGPDREAYEKVRAEIYHRAVKILDGPTTGPLSRLLAACYPKEFFDLLERRILDKTESPDRRLDLWYVLRARFNYHNTEQRMHYYRMTWHMLNDKRVLSEEEDPSKEKYLICDVVARRFLMDYEDLSESKLTVEQIHKQVREMLKEKLDTRGY